MKRQRLVSRSVSADAVATLPTWPLSSAAVRLLFLRACCAVAEGADVPLLHTGLDLSSRCPPDVCVAAVLRDALRRVAVLGGREGMRRSLGSVYGGSVTRFLGGSLRGVVRRVIDTGGVRSESNGAAVSRDGSTLLLSDSHTQAIHEFVVADGSRRRVVGGRGRGPLQFDVVGQMWIAPDGHVFVADRFNNRVEVLTPTLDFHAFVGTGRLDTPAGVCANDDVIVVAEDDPCNITVFNRGDGALVRWFGSRGSGDGQLDCPQGLCFMHDDRHVAVAEYLNHRVSVFSVDGEFIRHVGVGKLRGPIGVACSAFDELVVTDTRNSCIRVFSGVGDLVMTLGEAPCFGVALHGSSLFTHLDKPARCVVWE
jgi:sugar lactone lactonase YvrE